MRVAFKHSNNKYGVAVPRMKTIFAVLSRHPLLSAEAAAPVAVSFHLLRSLQMPCVEAVKIPSWVAIHLQTTMTTVSS